MSIQNRNPSTIYVFGEETTIHGMPYIFTHKSRHYCSRAFWLLLVIVMTTLVILQCKMTVDMYLSYEDAVRYTYDVKDKINFPAITICSENLFRRSMVGSNEFFLTNAKSYYGYQGDDEYEEENVGSENYETCTYDNGSYLNSVQPNIFNILFEGGLSSLLKLTSPTTNNTILKCWWNNKEVKCGDLFVDHLIDYGLCFTFNPSNSTNYVLQTLMGIETNYERMKSKINFVSKHASPNNGLRILLDSQRQEYCGTFRKWNGVGFRIQLHDRTSDATFLSRHGIMVYPGYSYNIAIKQTQFETRTENLGGCSSIYYDVDSKKSERDSYIQSACFLKCFIELVWKYCKCLPAYLVGRSRSVSKLLGINAKDNQLCTGWRAACMKDTELLLYGRSKQALECFECPAPCNLTKYEYEMSMVKFRHNQIDQSSRNDKWSTNYLILNFHYNSMTLCTVVTTQKFTEVDLYIYIGGTIGLFLGMSLMSIFEPFHYFTIYCIGLIKKKVSGYKKITKIKRYHHGRKFLFRSNRIAPKIHKVVGVTTAHKSVAKKHSMPCATIFIRK